MRSKLVLDGRFEMKKFRVIDKSGAVLVITSSGANLWVMPNEWEQLRDMLRFPHTFGNSYTSDFDEGIAKTLLYRETEKNPLREPEIREVNDYNHLFIFCVLGLLAIIGAGTVLKACGVQ